MTLSVKPQASIQLSAHIVKAFVSPIRKSGFRRWPIQEHSKDQPTDGQPEPRDHIKPRKSQLGWIVSGSGRISLSRPSTDSQTSS